MVKMRKLVVLISLLMVIISCSNKNDTQVNKSDLTENKAKNEVSTDTGYLKNITYSNLADKKVQNEVQEILKNSGVNPSNINLFFKSVNYYNEATQNKGLIKEGLPDNSIYIYERLRKSRKTSCKNRRNAFYGYGVTEKCTI